MNNQTQWIIRGAFIFVSVCVIAYSIFGARKPVQPAKPEPVPLTPVTIPGGTVTYTNGLPGSGGGGENSNSGGGGGSSPLGLGAPGAPGGGKTFGKRPVG